MGRKKLEAILEKELAERNILSDIDENTYLVLWDFKGTKSVTPSFYKRIDALARLTGKIKMLQQSVYLVRGFKLSIYLAEIAKSFGAEVRVLQVLSTVVIL